MLANILVYDIGSTYTKLAAFHISGEKLDFLGRAQALTTLEDICSGAKRAEEKLRERGIAIAKDAKRYSSCSAAGGLRMVALGYMPRVTAKAAKEVAMSAGARVMQVVSSDEPPEFRKEVLAEINPDIILLSGGTDGGDESCAIENARLICEVKCHATVIIACNKYAQKEVEDLFAEAGIHYIRVPNIMPTIHELNIKPSRDAIHRQFIRQITKAKGLPEFCERLSDKQVIPTPGAVLMAGELLAKGYYEAEGAGSLIIIDIGGATTDIHSVLPELENAGIEELGLVVNNEKQCSFRTVEGNLGLRVSATGVPETVGNAAILNNVHFDVEKDEVCAFANMLERQPRYLPENEKEKDLELALAGCAVKTALRRHAGHYAQAEDPVMGIMAGTPIGRDLRRVELAICVGGIFVHNTEEKAREIARMGFTDTGISLLPLHLPDFRIDRQYIFFALGVLARYYPEAVLYFLKEYTGCCGEKKNEENK